LAGATEVLVSSARRWALVHELRGAAEPSLRDLLRKLSPVDLVVVEGFKHGAHPKLEVFRASVGKPPLHTDDPHVVAVASDAPLDLPPFGNSAVDGFAVRHASLAADGETRLAIVGRVAAGHAAAQPVEAGEAVRIFTGAPMPAGADTVFMQEDCRIDGAAVVV